MDGVTYHHLTVVAGGSPWGMSCKWHSIGICSWQYMNHIWWVASRPIASVVLRQESEHILLFLLRMSIRLWSALLIAVERKRLWLINSCIGTARGSAACLWLRQCFPYNHCIIGSALILSQEIADICPERIRARVASESSRDLGRPRPHESFRSLMTKTPF